MEETASTANTKVSNDSAYSTCSNSQSRRSGSSKSHQSTSSTSSGYGGQPSSSTLESNNDQVFPEPSQVRKSKDKDHKKKKLKSTSIAQSPTTSTAPSTANPTKTKNEISSKENIPSSSPIKNIPSDSVLNSIMTNGATPSTDKESLQIAALSQTLLCFQKMKNKDQENNIDEEKFLHSSEKTDESFKKYVETSIKEKEFCVVVSMHDGIVLYSSSGLTDVLGFHKDMWLGRSFTDFVHPKDRLAFVSHVTSGITKPFLDEPAATGNKHNLKNSMFFCHLRCYRGLKSTGFNIIDQEVKYIACQFTLSFKEIIGNTEASCFLNSPHGIFSVINVQPVFSAYKTSNEICSSQRFMTRHLANGMYCHVDPPVVSYFGYLPQNMINHSAFDFYHADDLPALKETYKEVLSEQGQVVVSKPYKFKCQNGNYALIETEWSTFINPWSKNLEFVIGQHRVIQGPADIDITKPTKAEDASLEPNKQSEVYKKEILEILQKPVNVSNRVIKIQVSKRCKDLASFIETLVEGIIKPETKNDSQKDANVSERDSVMLGEISPHHEYGSKISSETPPSYNQLNYNDNIQRFFESQPKTSFSDETSENKGTNSPPESSETAENSTFSSSNHKTRRSNGLKSETTSSSENSELSSRNATKNFKKTLINYHPPPLTEEMLNRHNEDMEKQMVRKHRAQRGKSSKLKLNQRQTAVCNNHGVKRSGSHSWDSGPYRRSLKQFHMNDQACCNNAQTNRRSLVTVTMHNNSFGDIYNTPDPLTTSGLSTWPMVPFSSPTVHQIDHPEMSLPQGVSVNTPPTLPAYYVPREQQIRPEHAGPPFAPLMYITSPHQPHLMTPMIHSSWPGYNPVFYTPCPVMPSLSNLGTKQVQSEVTKKGGTTCVSSNNFSTGVFPSAREGTAKEESGELSFSETGDESSYYSSFYSFLKTEEKMDDSMRSSSDNDGKKYEDELWGKLYGTSEDDGSKKCLRKGPVWLEGVDVTPELQYRYQINSKSISDVLQADMEALAKLNQPDMVNEQLNTLYLELEGIYNSLKLEDSSSSGEEGTSNKTKKRKPINYDKMVMIFEGEAPLPPPITAAIPVSIAVAASSV